MTTITQDATPSKYANNKSSPSSASVYDKEPKDDFFHDYASRIYTPSKLDRELEMMGFDTIEPIDTNTNISSMFSPSSDNSSKRSLNNSASISDQPPSYSSNNSSSSSSHRTGTKVTAGGTKYNTYENDSAQKKFGTAKAISSDQFFNTDASSFERSANLAKFQGSNSISSAEYFGDGPAAGGRNSGGSSGRSKYNPTSDM